MVHIDKLERIVSEIPTPSLKRLAAYVQKNDPRSVSTTVLKDLLFTSSEASIVKDAIQDTKDGHLLAAYIDLLIKANDQEKSTDVRMVISGDFVNANADYTHETIYQMINKAKSEITIVGYWIYDIQDLLSELSRLQEEKNLRIRFIINSANKWKKQILKQWNPKCRPEIFEQNPNKIKSLHAKIIIIDRSEILVTSANLTINALKENIEAGIWTTKKNIINSCLNVLDEFETNGTITQSRQAS